MPITDLTGCVWVSTTDSLSETLNASYNNPYLINFTYNNDTYDSMFEDAGWRLAFSKNNVAIFVYNWDEGFWEDTPPITLTFTGGTDVTNSTLIAWLEANGTLTTPIVANTYTITQSLTNVTKGNITFVITPDAGYELPASSSNDFTITNGSIVSYDNSTGVLVVNGDDNTTISCECGVATPSGYSGNITADFYTFSGEGYTYIKFGSAPSSNSDYDAYVDTNGIITGSTTYTNQTKAYIWSVVYNGAVRINGTVTNCNVAYSNAIEITLTGNYDIELLYRGGSND